MNEQELQTTLKELQDVMVCMDGRLEKIEKQQSEAKDYSAQLTERTQNVRKNFFYDNFLNSKFLRLTIDHPQIRQNFRLNPILNYFV
ncbi:hypothetical protein [Sphingobacterium hotanense]|uniref:hypothetical protein n=1 Tax=Sphingobacterium hotanense TaxID=649196 RepID=UPI0021A830E2|nr:hypothetical protein [Sphingobacterium hotanense]MCT1526435.1 hypothetical protein [Sphingobacterium hotanense]